MLADHDVPRVVAAVQELRPRALYIQGNPRITTAGYRQLFACLATNDSLTYLRVGPGSPHCNHLNRPKPGSLEADAHGCNAIPEHRASANFDAAAAAQLVAALKTQKGLKSLRVGFTHAAGSS